MEVTIKIPDALAAQARERGMKPDVYVERLLAEHVANGAPKVSQPRTPEQIRAWLDSLAQFSDKIPPLPEVISREWIYQDRD